MYIGRNDNTINLCKTTFYPSYLFRLRFKPSSLARFMALWAKVRLKSGWVIAAMSLAVRLSISSRGANSGSVVGCALTLCGQHSWHSSQPYRRLPLACATHSGNSPRRSISWHERHRRASAARPSRLSAPPGHASTHSLHSPHAIVHGSSGSSANVVTTSPRKKNEPLPGKISRLFRPTKPIPAC